MNRKHTGRSRPRLPVTDEGAAGLEPNAPTQDALVALARVQRYAAAEAALREHTSTRH